MDSIKMREKLIENILNQIKSIEINILAIKEKESFSFSFLHDAFNKCQKLMRQLHDLEVIQVNALRQETEKLLGLLSEKVQEQVDKEQMTPEPLTNQVDMLDNEDDDFDQSDEDTEQNETTGLSSMDIRPLSADVKNSTDPNEQQCPINQHPDSVPNDRLANVQSSTHFDLKRSISLNDRYLFQRELFNNDRHEMNNMMLRLGSCETYEDAEAFLKEHTSWDFENESVILFLQALKKGFE